MPVDSSIYSQIQQPKPTNRLAEYAQMQQLQNSELVAAEKLQGISRQNRLMELAPQGVNALRGAGFWKEAMQMDQGAAETDNKRAQTVKYGADTAHKALETDILKAGIGAQILSTAVDQPSWDSARAEATARGLPTDRMPPVFDPAFVQEKLKQTLSVKEQLEQQWKQRNHELELGKAGETGRHNKAVEDNQVRGQNMTAGTAAAGQKLTDDRARDALTAGKAPAGYRWGPDGRSLEAIPGGPADIKNSAENIKKVGEAKDVLGLLDEVDLLLPKATGSYAGAAVDQIARVGGLATAGAEATAQLKTLQGALISKMPKMSGPQSDKDVQLYREMAGQVADQTLPVATRQKASGTIRALNEKYAGVSAGSSKKTVTRTGMLNGRKVVQYSDGTTTYAD